MFNTVLPTPSGLRAGMEFFPRPEDPATLGQLNWVATQASNAEQTAQNAVTYAIKTTEKTIALVNLHTAELNDKLKAIQLEMTLAADNAFSKVNMDNGRFTVVGKLGQLIVLCNRPCVFLCHIILDPHFHRENYFLIQFKDRDVKMLPESSLFKPSKLLSILSEAAGEPIRTCSNGGRITGILSIAITANATSIPLLYRDGWVETPSGWEFLLSNGKTHCAQLPAAAEDLPHTMFVREEQHNATLLAVEQMITMFEVFQDPQMAGLLFLWCNIAFLYTLLAEGCGAEDPTPVPMGLCLLVHGMYARRCMEILFQWYDDPMISLGEDPSLFKQMLGQRKDQPLLIKDDHYLTKNEDLLTQVLSSGSIPPVTRDEEPISLRSSVTVLSEGNTPLCCDPNFICVEFWDEDFSLDVLKKLPNLANFRMDYFRGLATFARENLELLQSLTQDIAVYDNNTCMLSSNGAKVFAALRNIRTFVRAYLEHLAPPEALLKRIGTLLAEDDSYLLNLLEQSYTVNDNVSQIFFGVADMMIRDGTLLLLPVRNMPDLDVRNDHCSGVVYYDSNYYYFDVRAYRKICTNCHKTTHAVLKSISTLLDGTPYCKSSSMTRITVTDKAGHSERISVYMLQRKLFKRSFIKPKV